jgi:hypothetical protein
MYQKALTYVLCHGEFISEEKRKRKKRKGRNKSVPKPVHFPVSLFHQATQLHALNQKSTLYHIAF